MLKYKFCIPASLITLLLTMLAGGCKNYTNIPFPVESGLPQPQTRPFAFSTPETINWIETNPDSIKPLPVSTFNFDKLPQKPFDIGGADTLLQALDEQRFDWNAVEEKTFDIDKLPTREWQLKISIPPKPQIVKKGLPHLKEGASRGVMEMNVDQNIIGKAFCYLIDSDGMMWIGTEKGLCRFDGENYEFFSSQSNGVISLLIDKHDQLWIGTVRGGLYVFNRKAGLLKQVMINAQRQVLGIMEDNTGLIWVSVSGNGVFIINPQKETVKTFGVKEGLSSDIAIRIMQDKQGLIWINTAGGSAINVIDLKRKKIKNLKKEDGLSDNDNNSICTLQDEKGRIWVGGYGGIDIINFKDGTIKNLTKKQGLTFSVGIFELMQDKQGKVWMGTDEGVIYGYDEVHGLLEKLNIAPGAANIVPDITEDNNGQLWVAVQNAGTFFINPANGRPGSYTEAQGLVDNNVWEMTEDDEGNIWMGTYKGIEVYDPHLKTLKHIGREHGLSNTRISTLLQDTAGQILAVGDNAGINIINKKNGTIKQLSKAQGLSDNAGSALLKDDNGFIWMSTYTGVVQLIDMQNRSMKKMPPLRELTNKSINTIIKDSKGQVWLGIVGGGVDVIDAGAKTVRHLSTANGLSNNDVYTIREDKAGRMWVGSEKGIDIVDMLKGSITSITTREGLLSNAVFSMVEKNGTMYAGTSNGLNIITPPQNDTSQGWSVRSFGKAQGLTHLDFNENAVLLTKNGQLWWGIENEVLTIMDEPKVDSNKRRVYITGVNIMDKAPGFYDTKAIKNNVKATDTIWRYEKDTFYFASNLPADSGYLTKAGISWDGVSGAYSLPVNLQLPYEQNFLNFHFNDNSFNNHENVLYRYVLEGIDKKWSDITGNNYTENYRNLAPGNYRFKVSSKARDGVWNLPAEFEFTIASPFWRTWWAYGVYAIIIALLIQAVIRYRSRTLKKENLLLEEKVQQRTNELQKSLHNLKETQAQLIQSEKMASLGELTAGIAHEIQNPLNFVNNFAEVNEEMIDEMKEKLTSGNTSEAIVLADDIKHNNHKIAHHSKRADAIVKGMMQHSRGSAGKKEPTDINALADEYLRLSYYGFRAKDPAFNVTSNTHFDETLEKISVVPQDIGRVLLNLYNNAFYSVTEKKKNGSLSNPNGSDHHSNGYIPTVMVTTSTVPLPDGGGTEIRVRDNGIGIPQKILDKVFQPFFTTKPTGQGTGLGLSLSYDIIKAHGGELKVETKEGEGAEFVIVLPVN